MTLPILASGPQAFGAQAAGSPPTGRARIAKVLHPVSVSVNASAPGAPVNEHLIGFDGPGAPGAFTKIAALHPYYIRTDVSFEGTYDGRPVYDCATGGWNPALTDSRVQQIREESARPELIVDYMPDCLASPAPPGINPNYEPPAPGASTTAWEKLVETMAVHEISVEGVRTFEIWNEPDWVFFAGGLSGYLRLYRITSLALEAAAKVTGRRIEVGGPALADVYGTLDTSFLDALLSEVVHDHLPLDFVSWHLYANDPDSGPQHGVGPLCIYSADPATNPCYYNPRLSAGLYAKETAQAKAALARYPQLHPKLWIDEWNVGPEYDARQSGPYDGAFVSAVLDAAQGAGVNRMCYFFVADSSDPYGNWGVLNDRYQPLPSYYAFDYWHLLAGDRLATSIAGGGNPFGPGSGGVGAVASTTPDGTIHVLVYDFMPFDPSGDYGTHLPTPTGAEVHLEVSGLTSATYGVRGLSMQSIDDAALLSSPGSSGSSMSATVTLPTEGVALLTLHPLGPPPPAHDLAGWLLALLVVIAVVIVAAVVTFVLRARRHGAASGAPPADPASETA